MILTNSFNPDVRVYKEARYLIENGHRVTVVCWDREKDTECPENELRDGIHIVRYRIPSVAGTGMKQLSQFIKFMHYCKEYIRNNSYDIVHCHDLDGMIVLLLVGIKKYKYVFDMHEYYISGNKIRQILVKKIVAYFIKNSQASLYENDTYLEVYKNLNHKLMPLKNYPDASMLLPREKKDSLYFRIGYHGTLRNQIAEFTALFEACKDIDNVKVIISGGGIDLPKLKEIQKAYHNVTLNGPYDGVKETSKLYQETDILFCGYNPYNPNYQGHAEVIKFYEAIYTGTPLIMTSGIGMGEKVSMYDFGVTCDTRNSNAIKQAIMKLKQKDFYNYCSKNELLHADEYCWDNAVQILKKIYSQD